MAALRSRRFRLQKMPRFMVRILASIAGGVVVSALVFLAWLILALQPTRDEVAAVPSPDGQFVARLYEINGGATTSFGYQVTLAETRVSAEHEVAHLYGAVRNASAYGANLRWAQRRELSIEFLEARSTNLVAPTLRFPRADIVVVLRSGIADESARPGAMSERLPP
jgi:hypothetical protein